MRSFWYTGDDWPSSLSSFLGEDVELVINVVSSGVKVLRQHRGQLAVLDGDEIHSGVTGDTENSSVDSFHSFKGVDRFVPCSSFHEFKMTQSRALTYNDKDAELDLLSSLP